MEPDCRYEVIVKAKQDLMDHVQAIVKESMEEALKRIIPEVTFVGGIRVAEAIACCEDCGDYHYFMRWRQPILDPQGTGQRESARILQGLGETSE
jgi:hypothetical protein